MLCRRCAPSFVVVGAVAIAVMLPASAAAAPSDPDATFGTGGRQAVGAPTGIRVEEQGDKLLVAATRFNPSSSTNDISVSRYSAGGALDTSFGTGGTAFVGSPNADQIADLEVAPDGSIVVAANRVDDIAVGRLSRSGVPESGFGVNGFASIPQAGNQTARRVVTPADGRIVVLGEEAINGRSSMYAFTPSGGPDASFGGDGIVEVDMGADTSATTRGDAFGIALDGLGRLVLAGRNGSGKGFDVAIARYLPTGAPDTSFGTGGATVENLGYPDSDAQGELAPIDAASDLTVAADGTILVFGYLYWQGRQAGPCCSTGPVPHEGSGVLLARFATGGAFAGQSLGETTSIATGRLAAATDGTVYGLVRNDKVNANNGQPARLVRFGGASHAFDGTFGAGGFADASLGTGVVGLADAAQDITVQPDGRPVIAGVADPETGADSASLLRLVGTFTAPVTPPADPVTPAPDAAPPAQAPPAQAPPAQASANRPATTSPAPDRIAPRITAKITARLLAPKSGVLPLGTLGCPATEATCAYRLKLTAVVRVKVDNRAAKRVTVTLGSARLAVRGGARQTAIRVKLSASARATLAKSRRLSSTLSIEVRDAAGNKRTTTRKLALVAPRR